MKLCFISTFSITLCAVTFGLPIKTNQEESSSISKIVIPYAPYTTDLIKDAKGKVQRVFVPLKMDIVPQINLKEGEIAMGSQKGMALNFAEGAYPVYYMQGNANGKFQNKMIYVLE